MNPLFKLLWGVIQSYPVMLANPTVLILFAVVLGLVWMQYSRVQSMEESIYGRRINPALKNTLVSVGLGLVAGLAASVLLVMVGVTVSDSGVGYLLPVALLLFLFSPRFLCFSYAGGLLCASYLLFGWPQVNVAAITALVACLHAAESFLIRLSGDSCATPIYVDGKDGRPVGAFSLQRFWPIPIIALVMVRVPDVSALTGLIDLPDWWPLVKAPEVAGVGTPIFAMTPVIAALGYGDLAQSRMPKEKAKMTSRNLFLYSAILLGFAIAASRWPAFSWIAVLFAPIGHEVVIREGNRDEQEREPLFVSSAGGLMILDVFKDSPAYRAGITRGSIITEAQGAQLRSRQDLDAALAEGGDIVLTTREPRSRMGRQVIVRRSGSESLGVVLSPGLGDRAFMKAQQDGPLLHLFRRLLNKA